MNLNVTMLGQIITFVLFVLFCMKYIWPPLIGVIENRQKEISDHLNSVEIAKKEYFVIKTKADEYLQESKIKAKDIIQQANVYEKKLIEEAQIKAKYEYEKLLSDAKKEIVFERNRMRDDLLLHFSSLVFAGVERIVKHKVDMGGVLDESIVNDLIKEL